MIPRIETWLRAAALPGAWLLSLLFHDWLQALPTVNRRKAQEILLAVKAST